MNFKDMNFKVMFLAAAVMGLALFSTAQSWPTNSMALPPSPPTSSLYHSYGLGPGWRMISMPIQDNLRVTGNTCGSPAIWWYNSYARQYERTLSFDQLMPGKGYWVKINQACQLGVQADREVDLDGYYLNDGWNQIGSPYTTTLWSDIAGTCQATSGPWQYNTNARTYEKASVLSPGFGYWVKVAGSCQLSSNQPPLPPSGGYPTPISVVSTATPTPTTSVIAPSQGPSLKGAAVRGSGRVAIVEFSDFQCPFCARAHPVIKSLVEQTFPGKVKWAYKHFPLDSIHPDARRAAHAFECARDQSEDKAWQYADVLFADQADLSEAGLLARASQVSSLDVTQLKACLVSGVKASKVESDYQEGIRLGMSGTPTFYLSRLDAYGNPYGGWVSIVGAQASSIFQTQILNMLNYP